MLIITYFIRKIGLAEIEVDSQTDGDDTCQQKNIPEKV